MRKNRYNFLLVLLALLISIVHVSGQNRSIIDSLKTANALETNQKNITDNYLDIAAKYSHHLVDSAFLYIDKALMKGTEISYKEGVAEAYFMQSYYHDLRGEYSKSIESMEKAITLFEELGDSSYLSGCYNNLGALYSYGTEQKKSLEYFIKSINTGEELRDSFSLAEAYSNLAGFYEDLKEYSSALKYFKKALDIDLHYNSTDEVAISHLDVGHMNTKLLRYEDALANLEEAKSLMNDIHDDYYKIILLQRFGNYYKETGELDLAESTVLKAQKLSTAYNYPMLDAETLSIKGEILLKQKRFNESLAVLDSAIARYNSINAQGTFNELYKNKADANFGLGLHNRAYQLLQLANKENESLKSNEIAEVLSEFEKQEAIKEERARLRLVQELEEQKNENTLIQVRTRLYLTIALAILFGLITLVALYLFMLKRNHNKLLESNYELINQQKDVIEESYSELKDNEKRLAELNATKDKFFSIIAHDLKNPFNTLIGISELMISNPEIKDTEDFEELLHGMFQTAQSGHDLLENLLEWSRSQIGHLSYEPQLLSLHEIFESTASFFRHTAKAKNIKIEILSGNGQKICADHNMVNFIIRNLVNNAIKFSHPNSTIKILSSTENNKTIICIKDSGIGMSQDTIDKLFKIEHSIQQNGTADEKGTGLGLILCKEFIEKNGGGIWVESQEQKGSKFSFSLPQSCK